VCTVLYHAALEAQTAVAHPGHSLARLACDVNTGMQTAVAAHAVVFCAGVRGLQLPDGLFDSTPGLEVLLACRAGLSEFPKAVLAASSLTRLGLGSNSISTMPVEVTQLTRCG
jgi:hypothetical protein